MRLSDLADESTAAPASTPMTAHGTAHDPADQPDTGRDFAVLLGEFRRTAVLVPIDPYGGLWTAEQGGVRWICAFSNAECLARFAEAQGDADRGWEYRTILGARLLDVLVPKLTAASGAPAGVALDAGSDDGMVFPPVEGVVPDSAVVDLGGGA